MLGSNLSSNATAPRKVAGSGGGSKPERLCAFCVCAFCVCVYLCAAKVVESEGGSKPERLCAFSVCKPLRCESYGIRRRE